MAISCGCMGRRGTFCQSNTCFWNSIGWRGDAARKAKPLATEHSRNANPTVPQLLLYRRPCEDSFLNPYYCKRKYYNMHVTKCMTCWYILLTLARMGGSYFRLNSVLRGVYMIHLFWEKSNFSDIIFFLWPSLL